MTRPGTAGPPDPPDPETSPGPEDMPVPTEPLPPEEPLPPSERRNPASTGLDRLGTAELLALINREDAGVPGAVAAALPAIEALVEAGLAALARGARVHYFGAGSSGRAALADAAELLPTYGVGPETVCPHLAGGPAAGRTADEAAEDRTDGIETAGVRAGDLVIGISASGRTAYVGAALAHGRAAGAVTALISGDPAAPLAARADLHIVLATGPEVLTGSTRMKAATAQKLALNMFSTALMVRTGRTWSNLMVTASAGNAKLHRRAVRTLSVACGVPAAEAERALRACGDDTATALVSLLAGVGAGAAAAALRAAGGLPAAAVRQLTAAAAPGAPA
ncbi:N-acetylmuramic acid 6-phosphate etherase, partial [Kitasatospora herbaricolor]|uniref:N-acetylmuramic acid 6-phosphate etherase n=2 Tax=Kitasatospora herbaricolor TaxID=68217 RepID=UPI0036DB7152